MSEKIFKCTECERAYPCVLIIKSEEDDIMEPRKCPCQWAAKWIEVELTEVEK